MSTILDSLSTSEMIVLSDWSLAAWPAGIPKSEESRDDVIVTAREFVSTGHTVSIDSLNLAAKKLEGKYRAKAQEERRKLEALGQLFVDWAASRHGSWPHPESFGGQALPENEATGQRILETVERNGWQWSPESFDAALHALHINALFTAPAVSEFVRNAPAELHNAQGRISYNNLYTIVDSVLATFRGQVTVKNLQAALTLLHSQGKIQWERPLPTPQEVQKRLEKQDADNRVADLTANVTGRGTGTTNEAEKLYRAAIDKAFKQAAPSSRAKIAEIVQAHQKANLPLAATVMEVSAFSWVQTQLANPPGATHADFESVRKEINRVVMEEQQHSVYDRSVSDATWKRIAERVQSEVLNTYSRSIR